MTPSLKKCFSLSNIIDYLGNAKSSKKLQVVCRCSDAIKLLLYSCDVSNMPGFLVNRDCYPRIVPTFQQLAELLNQRLNKSKTARFVLNDCKKNAVVSLSQILPLIPVLALFRVTGYFKTDTDGRNYQAGCVLFEKPVSATFMSVAYWSSSRVLPKDRYGRTQKEFLGRIWSLLTASPCAQ